jgi:hypothetical protein
MEIVSASCSRFLLLFTRITLSFKKFLTSNVDLDQHFRHKLMAKLNVRINVCKLQRIVIV